jgi:hypothetical protein
VSVVDAAKRLKQELADLQESGRAAAREYGRASASLRKLVMADLMLARDAMIRGLVFLLLCALAAGTAWAVAMAMLVIGMIQLGLPLQVALLIPLLVSLTVAYFAWKGASYALSYSDLDATRRQLGTWFPDDELEEEAARAAAAATESVPTPTPESTP